jgi:DNA polymerase III subunit gamma/tau
MSTDLSLFPAEPSPAASPLEESGERTSLYRAYRSRTFAEVVGQQHVTQTLRNAVIHGKVGHAYIFTGPRGTGKTSTARILARAVNCLAPKDGEPCNECAICLSMLERRSIDLIEIDGASNNSVDDVRELRDRVQFRPAEARRKVFIIDEVHMLSIGAFNALLKTLEEPPDHILFLLATTEIHKVPLTVLSRCQRHDLRSVPLPEMTARLKYVCEQEGLEAEDTVIELLATLGTGSLRDAESLLEQVRAYCGDSLRLAEVEAALGVARMGEIAVLADLMAAGDLAESLLLLGTMMDGGIEPRQLTRQLSGYWRDAVLARARRKPVAEPNVARCTADKIVAVLRSLLSVESVARRSDSPRFALELAVAEATLQLAPGAGAGVSSRPASSTVGPETAPEPELSPRVAAASVMNAKPIPTGIPSAPPETGRAGAGAMR